MRTTVLKVSLFLCAFVLLTGGKAAAMSADQLALTGLKISQSTVETKDSEDEAAKAAKEAESKAALEEKFQDAKETELKKPVEVAPVQHTVAAGENLSKIAKVHNIEWKRIFNKNTAIANPDTISVGQVVVIPTAEEVLEDRVIVTPEPVAPVQTAQASTARRSRNRSATPQATGSSRRVARGSSAGNTYAPGYCTWYVKSRRPDIPNRMGNASAWVSSARSQGLATGSTPQVGAVAQSGNHVAYVEAVNGNTVTVSEMNWVGLYVTSTRTTSAGSFTYIY